MSEHYYSWAWSPDYVAQQAKKEQSGLILPGDYRFSVKEIEQTPEAAIVHFGGLNVEGQEKNWLWLFNEVREAASLRLLPTFAEGREIDLIEATLPQDQPGKPPQVYVQIIPREWLLDWRLEEQGISEIWLGFNYKIYAQDRNLLATCQRFSTEEFLEKVKRTV